MEYNYRLRLRDWRFMANEAQKMEDDMATDIQQKITEYDTPLSTSKLRESLKEDDKFEEEVTDMALKQLEKYDGTPMHGMYPKTIPLSGAEYRYLTRHLRKVENKNIFSRLLHRERVKQAKRVRRALDNQFYALSVNSIETEE